MASKKILLDEEEIPKQWYNIVADLPGTMNPPLGPDGNPVGPEMLAPVFPMNLIEQEVSTERWIDIPEEARQLMHRSTHRRCPETPERPALYLAALHIGLAPGGVVQVWTRNECNKPVPVARAQAEIEPRGPHLGKSGGKYYPLSDASKRYIEKFGIPYGSW